VSSGLGSPEERKKWHAAWVGWYDKQGGQVDLARLDEALPFQRLTLVPEMHGGKVWEVGADGKVRWTLDGLRMPRDAQVLPGGRVLVCEVTTNRVAEFDLKGNVVWSHPAPDPAYAQRLVNGNTFIATHQRSFEVTRDGKEVYSHQAEPGFFIHSTHRMANGHLVWLSMDGRLRELVPQPGQPQGKVVREFRLQAGPGNWCGVEGLGGGRYLAVELNRGLVVEVDAEGKTVWQCTVAGASYACRMPNGHTMVCSFNERRVVHVDREGRIVWQKEVGSQPWRAHVR
jgi:hypothetical protein